MTNVSTPPPRPPRPIAVMGRVVRIVLPAGALWLIWTWDGMGAKSIDVSTLVAVQSSAELAALAPGREFLLEGTVHPARAGAAEMWEGRFAFHQSEQKKVSDGADSSAWTTVVLRDVRPALQFRWGGAALNLPASGYGLRYAPAAPRPASGKSSAMGFKPGDPAVVHGVIAENRTPVVQQLAAAPRAAYVSRLARGEAVRSWLGYSVRAFLSLVVLALASPAWKPAESPLAPKS